MLQRRSVRSVKENAMIEYAGKQQLIDSIKTSASLYIKEFDVIDESEKDLRMEEGERTPYENIAYQLGWMNLIQQWEKEEQEGRIPEMPAPGVKWNKLGQLHQQFYASYRSCSMQEMKVLFSKKVEELCVWLDSFEASALFQPGGRKWAQSTSSNWPVWKWIYINTVAPFKTFRTKIRKWKRLKSA